MGEERPSFTVSAELVNGLMACAAQCGLPPAQLAAAIAAASGGISPAPARYPSNVVFALWDRIHRLSGDPAIGFRMALFATPKTFGAVGQILPRCATLLDAFLQISRYSALASQGARVLVSANSKTVSVSIDPMLLPGGNISRTVTLWGLTNIALLPERLSGVAVRPKVVNCSASSPGPDAIRAIKAHMPISFDARTNELVFERRAGDLAIPTADADLKALLADVMDRHLAALGPAGSFEQGIATVLRSMSEGNIPTLASLSARVGMSERTLQRRLSESGTSFQQLLRQVLLERSEELLAREGLSHGEIAFLLGYSEESAFSRAYKSWTGYPPGKASSHRAAAL